MPRPNEQQGEERKEEEAEETVLRSCRIIMLRCFFCIILFRYRMQSSQLGISRAICQPGMNKTPRRESLHGTSTCACDSQRTSKSLDRNTRGALTQASTFISHIWYFCIQPKDEEVVYKAGFQRYNPSWPKLQNRPWCLPYSQNNRRNT